MATIQETATYDVQRAGVSIDAAGDCTIQVEVKRADGTPARMRSFRYQTDANGGAVVNERGQQVRASVRPAVRAAITALLAEFDADIDAAASGGRV